MGFLCLVPSYAFAIGNVRIYLRIGPNTGTNRQFSKTCPNAQTEAQKRTCPGKPVRMVTLYGDSVGSMIEENSSALHNLNMQAAISKHMWAVKLCKT